MAKNVLAILPDKRILYTMPDNVYTLIKGIYMQFNVDIGIRMDFETIYKQLPDSLKEKVKRKEGKEADFNNIRLDIREYPDDPLDGLS